MKRRSAAKQPTEITRAISSIAVACVCVCACSSRPAPSSVAVAHHDDSVAHPPDAMIVAHHDDGIVRPPDPVGAVALSTHTCAIDTDCVRGERCFAPDFVPGPGARPPPPSCYNDAACGAGRICQTSCVLACKPGSCGAGWGCGANGHCAPLPCTDPAAPICAQNSRCDATTGTCARVACHTAADCDSSGAACVDGHCFAHAASCMPENYCCPP